MPLDGRYKTWPSPLLKHYQALYCRLDVHEALCSYSQVIEALLVAIDLAAIVVFQGDANACHRETSWGFACLTRGKTTLACIFMLCPVPSPKNLQEVFIHPEVAGRLCNRLLCFDRQFH